MQTHKMSRLWREATKLPCPPFLRSRCLVQTAYDLRIPIQRYRFDVEKKRDIYMYVYTVSFRRKGSRKAVLSSNLRTLDTQNKVTLISQPPQEIFFLLDLGDILLRGYTIASRSRRDFIFPSSSFQRNQPHFSFSFFEEKYTFVSFFSSFPTVSSKSLRLTRIASILNLDATKLR